MTVKKMQARELHERIEAEEALFLLDVRNEQDYNEWKIQHAKVQTVNFPYFNFLEDDNVDFERFPKDMEIVVICAKGNSAQVVATQLDEKGYDVSYLIDGMLAWSQFYHAVTILNDQQTKLVQFNRLAKGCLSYMVISQGEALIVDPGRHAEEYIRFAERENATIKHIMDTHLHADHISGGQELAAKTGATYYISSSEMQGSDVAFEPLEAHPVVQFGAVDVKVMPMQTPGHTPGSTSFLINDAYLLSGDTIFVGGLGRPDLGGKAREWAQSLYDTVFTTIAGLADDVLVLPTHFADIREINVDGFVGATLGEIRKSNEIMRTTDREQFTDQVAGGSGATPPNYAEIVGINRGTVEVDAIKAMELEIGPNRCAVKHS